MTDVVLAKMGRLMQVAQKTDVANCRCSQDFFKADGKPFAFFSKGASWPNVASCLRADTSCKKDCQSFKVATTPKVAAGTLEEYKTWAKGQCRNTNSDFLVGCVAEKRQGSKGFCVECPFCVDQYGKYEALRGRCSVPTTTAVSADAGSFDQAKRLRPVRN